MQTRFSRRTLIVGAGAGTGLAFGIGSAARAATDDPELIATRRVTQLVGDLTGTPPASVTKKIKAADDVVASLLGDTDVSGSSEAIWPDLDLAGIGRVAAATGNLGVTFDRLLTIAKAVATPGSRYHRDAAATEIVSKALGRLTEFAYRPDVPAAGNWWFWEIGIPRDGADIAVLLGSALPTATRDALFAAIRHFTPDPNYRGRTPGFAETGANRVDKALSCVLRGVADGTTADIEAGRDALTDVRGNGRDSVFGYVTSGDGYYADGSFIQHDKLPYAGSYGAVALQGVSRTLALVTGTAWAVTDPASTSFFDVVEATYAPFMVDLYPMDTVRGRAVSRQRDLQYIIGYGICEAVLTLAEAAPPATAKRLRSIAKGWIHRTTRHPMTTDPGSTVPQALAAHALLQDKSIQVAEQLVMTKFFGSQERLVHRRPTWSFSVNTSSTRIGRFEWGNAENIRGWYQGDGQYFLHHIADPAQYADDFWPVIDSTALPGTTESTEARVGDASEGTGIPSASNSYNGGLTIGDGIGTVAMDFGNQQDTVTAYKSWFTFPEEVVCVTSNVRNTSGHDVKTYLEQRVFEPGTTPRLTVDGSFVPSEVSDNISTVKHWAHVARHAGFVLLPIDSAKPAPAKLHLTRRTGTWWDIDQGADTYGDKTVRTKDVLRIDTTHTTANAAFAYRILPLATRRRTQAAVHDGAVRVVCADDTAHVIHSERTSTTLAHFFVAAERSGITVSHPCSVAWRQIRNTRYELVISDPTRAAGKVLLTLPIGGSGYTLTVDLSATFGASKTVQVDLLAP